MVKLLSKAMINKGLSNVNEVWGSEISLYYESLYAGTADLIGKHKDIPSIIDFKNSLRPKKKEWIESYFCQRLCL